MAEVGYRVIRGPNWPLQDEDGGDGCVGTVVEVGGKGKSTLPRNLVIVHWDMGNRLDHRAGYYGDYDLYVVDTAPAGIKHDGVQCCNKNCGQKHIQGMRWCCLDCSNNYNLCTNCYMFDEHNKAHAFKRIDNPGASGIRVGKRMGTEKMQKRGIFKGSKVMRGGDWRWDNQDGGAGKVGVVLEIQDWKPEFPKTSVKVSWAYAEKQNYRVGYKGKVDLKCLVPGIGGLIYKSHLPVLGEDVPLRQTSGERGDTLPAKKTEGNRKAKEKDLKSSNSNEGNKIKKRNKKANEKERQPPQKDKPKKVTEVKGGKDEGPARSNSVVQKNGSNVKRDEVKETAERRKKAAAEAVRNQNQASRSNGNLQPGDSVRILEDKEKVRKLQIGHGHWNDEISNCVGQLAQVLTIDEDGDVEVELKLNGNSMKIIFNPAALRLENSASSVEANTKDNSALSTKVSTSEDSSHGSRFVPNALGVSIEELSHIVEVPEDIHLATKDERESAVILVGSAGQGDLAVVERVLDRYPYIIDVKVQGQTALHQACHNGRMNIVDFLLKNKASLTIKDHQEFTALHHSAYGDKQGNTAGLVIFAGTEENLNENGNPQQASPIHLAVLQYNPNVVQVLLQAGCDLTLKDVNGDTPLHDALRVGDYNIALAILSSKGAESAMSVCNKQGANPLIQAVCSRFTPIARKMVEAFPRIINAVDKHGNTALHYAAVYEDMELAKCLLDQGENCDLEIRNKNGQTARELAEAASSPVWKLLLNRNQGISQNTNEFTAVQLKILEKALPQSKMEKSGTYNIGDTIKVREAWTVVAALAHYHGEWTSGMKSVLGLTGEIRDIHDDDGDLDVLMENGLHFRFNSLAVTHGITLMDESVTTTTCGQMSQDLQMMPYYGVPEMLPESVDLSLSDDEDTLGSALFLAIGMGMTWRVKEILERNPILANHVEDDVPVLSQAVRDGSVEIVEELLKHGAQVNEKNPGIGDTALFDAAISDKSGKTVKLLLQKSDCDPNVQQCTSGRTALHAAILSDNTAAVKALVEGGSSLSVQNIQGDTVYHEAAKKERVEMLRILLEDQNVDLCNMFNGTGLNVIHIAAHTGNATIVRMLLEKSPDLVRLFTMDENNATPLHIACLKGHFEVVDALLNTGLCDVYAEDASGRTALAVLSRSNDDQLISLRLVEEYEKREVGEETRRADSAVTNREIPHFAIDDVVKIRSNLDLLKTLQKNHGGFNEDMVEALDKQGQILSIDEDGDVEVLVGNRLWYFNPAALIPVSSRATAVERTGTQVERINQKKKPKTVEWLNQQLRDLLSVGVEGSSDDLGAAVVFNYLSRVKAILTKQPEMANSVLDNGATLLHIACRNLSLDVIKCLLDHGAFVDMPDETGRHPLHVAALSDQTGEVVRILTDYGADPNTKMTNNSSSSPLHLAVLTGHAEAATTLVEKGATVNVVDARGDTPFSYAVKQKKNEMVDILLNSSDFDPQFSGAGGYTALHHASRLGNDYVVEKLVECYKDSNMDFVNLPSENGSTALLLAAENNKVDAARLLLQTGKCEVNKKKNTGQTPLDVAISNGHRDLADLLRSNGGVTNTSKPEDNINHGPSPSSVLEQPIIASLAESSKQPEDAVSRILNPFNAPDDDDREDFPEQVASSANDNREQERDKSERSSKIEKKQVSEIAPSSTSLGDSTLKQEENHETPATKMVSVEKETIENDKGEQAKLENTIPLPNAFTTDHHDERRTPPKDQCIKCKTAAATVIFLPCNHKITCKDCSRREKSCKTCGTAIKEKTQESVTSAEESGKTSAVGDVSTNPSFEPQDSSTECQICFDNTRAVTFRPCGHCVACSECAKFLVECSICRASITEKITTILS